MADVSKWLADQRLARHPAILDLISKGSARIRKVLEREGVCHQRTLEQKISDQGPVAMRVDPHLVGLALRDLVEREILAEHSSAGVQKWFSHRLEKPERIEPVLATLAPLYAQVSTGHFPNRVGDALEIAVLKALRAACIANPQLRFFGSFELDQPKDANGRYRKSEPPQRIGDHKTVKQADFLLAGYPEGIIGIECKNLREWIYPHSSLLKELVLKSYELNVIPLLIARRIHYATITNFLKPAGIIAHQSYFQYYPADAATLAATVKHKRSLGFTDVTALETPHERTTNFFADKLPAILPAMAERWHANKAALYDYATNGMNLAQVYTAVGSPVGGKWQEREHDEPDPEDLADMYRDD